jgi:hypothetical protein
LGFHGGSAFIIWNHECAESHQEKRQREKGLGFLLNLYRVTGLFQELTWSAIWTSISALSPKFRIKILIMCHKEVCQNRHRLSRNRVCAFCRPTTPDFLYYFFFFWCCVGIAFTGAGPAPETEEHEGLGFTSTSERRAKVTILCSSPVLCALLARLTRQWMPWLPSLICIFPQAPDLLRLLAWPWVWVQLSAMLTAGSPYDLSCSVWRQTVRWGGADVWRLTSASRQAWRQAIFF